MAINWDPGKLKANIEKHGVHFADAVPVLEDPLVLGLDALARTLVVVYTWRGGDIRLISARRADPRERKDYENQ